MEASKERVGLLDKILPPALADAGLEDCARPPDSIEEAFRKAADAVKSRAASLSEDEEEGCCVTDPQPALKGTEKAPTLGASDTIIVGGENERDTGPYLSGQGNGKLAELEEDGDLVVAGEGGEWKSCGDGLKDLVDAEGLVSSREKKDQSEEDEEEEMKPILVEGYV